MIAPGSCGGFFVEIFEIEIEFEQRRVVTMIGHGGKRPGAGRPRKLILGSASSLKMMPLEYLLVVMRDESVDLRLRIAAAKAALPYCSKKVVEEAAAPDAVDRDSWANILTFRK
jgi:hypothetical protein